MKLGMEIGLGPVHTVLDEDPTPPPPKKGHNHSQFSAHVCCGQMAGWIKMSLGTEVGLGLRDILAGWMKTPLGTEVDLRPGHIVLHGPSSHERGTAAPPLFGSCLLWPRSPISATAELLLHSSGQGVPILYRVR